MFYELYKGRSIHVFSATMNDGGFFLINIGALIGKGRHLHVELVNVVWSGDLVSYTNSGVSYTNTDNLYHLLKVVSPSFEYGH